MRTPSHIALAFFAFVSAHQLCDAKEPVRDGSSFEKAIIVNIGPAQEVAWEMVQIRKFHPDANLGDAVQALASHNGRMYDVYEFHTKSGKKIGMFFDIGPEKKP